MLVVPPLSVLSGGIHGVYSDYEKHFDLRENYSLKNAADAAGACLCVLCFVRSFMYCESAITSAMLESLFLRHLIRCVSRTVCVLYHSLAFASGFYNDIALDSFSRENPNIAFVHAAPGLVASNWGTELNFFMRGIARAALHVRHLSTI